MKKYICALLVLFICVCLIVPMRAEAVSPRFLAISPALYFTGKTANCELMVNVDNTTDRISAVIILWKGNSAVKQWKVSDTGHLSFYDTHPNCVSGASYVLSVDVTLNGVLQQRIMSPTKTCP